MQRLQFLSSISGLALASLAGCSDDSCGPGKAQDAPLLASNADVIIKYGNLTSGPNNDCGELDPSTGIVSLTLEGTQLEGPGRLTLCIRRPDLLQKGAVQLGTGVLIIDFNAEVDGCMYEYEQLRPVTGDVTAAGMCDNGKSLAGYALTVDGALSLRRMCPTANDTIAVSFAGTVAVEGLP